MVIKADSVHSWVFKQSGGDFVPHTCILTTGDVKEKHPLCDVQKYISSLTCS